MPDDAVPDTSNSTVEDDTLVEHSPLPEDNVTSRPSRAQPKSRKSNINDTPNTTVGGSSLGAPSGAAKHKDIDRPPLPPRPSNLALLQEGKSKSASLGRDSTLKSESNLQSLATTAVSRTDIQTHSFQDGSPQNFAVTAGSTPTNKSHQAFGSVRRIKNISGSETGDTASVRSLTPTLSRIGDNESLLGDVFGTAQDPPTWNLLGGESGIPESSDV